MKMLALILGAMMVAGANCAECDVGWVKIEDSCFHFNMTTEMDWAASQEFCQVEGAELAVILDSNTHRGFVQYVQSYGLTGSFWLGGSDRAFEDDWVWDNRNTRVERGTPFWALHYGVFGWDNEPAGGEEENCLALDEERKYFFNDHDCLLLHHPVCMAI